MENFEVEIDKERIKEVANMISSLSLKRDKYDNLDFFPPYDADRELQLSFFTVMVAIDHRTRNNFTNFEAYIDGKHLFGADLLYYLGMKLFKKNPKLFLPENLTKIHLEEWKDLLGYGKVRLWDYKLRLFLIWDIGKKVLEFYSSFEKLFSVSTIEEFRKRMRIFRAYEDPVEKKTFLLAKFLEGRGLVKFVDSENFEVAVDNHLSRIAIRIGIVKFSNYSFIERGIEVSRDDDIKIRFKIREAWKIVSNLSGVDPFTLDDFLWSFGRNICTSNKPKCDLCPFKEKCLANALGKYFPEHKHLITWYY